MEVRKTFMPVTGVGTVGMDIHFTIGHEYLIYDLIQDLERELAAYRKLKPQIDSYEAHIITITKTINLLKKMTVIRYCEEDLFSEETDPSSKI